MGKIYVFHSGSPLGSTLNMYLKSNIESVKVSVKLAITIWFMLPNVPAIGNLICASYLMIYQDLAS